MKEKKKGKGKERERGRKRQRQQENNKAKARNTTKKIQDSQIEIIACRFSINVLLEICCFCCF